MTAIDGKGLLVIISAPSGAGKDTVIGGMKVLETVVYVRRRPQARPGDPARLLLTSRRAPPDRGGRSVIDGAGDFWRRGATHCRHLHTHRYVIVKWNQGIGIMLLRRAPIHHTRRRLPPPPQPAHQTPEQREIRMRTAEIDTQPEYDHVVVNHDKIDETVAEIKRSSGARQAAPALGDRVRACARPERERRVDIAESAGSAARAAFTSVPPAKLCRQPRKRAGPLAACVVLAPTCPPAGLSRSSAGHPVYPHQLGALGADRYRGRRAAARCCRRLAACGLRRPRGGGARSGLWITAGWPRFALVAWRIHPRRRGRRRRGRRGGAPCGRRGPTAARVATAAAGVVATALRRARPPRSNGCPRRRRAHGGARTPAHSRRRHRSQLRSGHLRGRRVAAAARFPWQGRRGRRARGARRRGP